MRFFTLTLLAATSAMELIVLPSSIRTLSGHRDDFGSHHPDVGAGGGAVALRDFGHLISLVTHDLR
jgi:hypothetical protein